MLVNLRLESQKSEPRGAKRTAELPSVCTQTVRACQRQSPCLAVQGTELPVQGLGSEDVRDNVLVGWAKLCPSDTPCMKQMFSMTGRDAEMHNHQPAEC